MSSAVFCRLSSTDALLILEELLACLAVGSGLGLIYPSFFGAVIDALPFTSGFARAGGIVVRFTDDVRVGAAAGVVVNDNLVLVEL